MPTVMDAAMAADAAYEPHPRLEGWTLKTFRPSGKTIGDAFQGALFVRGDEAVIAFKGTSQKRDFIADAKLAVGMNTYQYSDACEFVDENVGPLKTAYLVGHSLGGAIAQIVANRRGLRFVTFNAPGVGLASRNLDQMAVSVATGSAAVRLKGAVASAILHPTQALEDFMAFGRTVNGINYRVGKDAVGITGVHFGKVVELPWSGNATDVLAKHSMKGVLQTIKEQGLASVRLDTVV